MEREPRAEHEAPRLDRHDGLGPRDERSHPLDRERERLRVPEERRDVLEHDPLAGEVGDVADPSLEIRVGRRAHQCTRVPAESSMCWSSIARRSFSRARASIWRARSRVMPK